MNPVYLSKLLTLQSQWLTSRQGVTASNVANANTPAYQAHDIQPFEDVLRSTSEALTRSSPLHQGDANPDTFQLQPEMGWETAHSGNSVSLEQQLLRAGETSRAYRFNINLDKAFGRLMDLAIKGSSAKGG